MVEQRVAVDGSWQPHAWIVEDEPAAATLAAELCEASGAVPSVFRLPLAFLTAMRSSPAPAVVVLDWRLENELSAALFMATRHRYPRLPIIYWTGSRTDALPSMIQGDRYTIVVDKAAGASPFQDALSWALDDEGAPTPERSPAR